MEIKKIKKILLTGATGFIGSHLLDLLVRKDYKVTVLGRNFSDTWRINHLMDKIKYYNIDKVNLENIFKHNTFDCIIHLAAFYKKHHEGADDVKKMIDANILFPTVLLELSVKYNIRYFINTGTFFEYKLGKRTKLVESSSLEPYDLYAATKISFENILKYYAERHNIKGITLKLFAPYGEKDNEKLIVFLIKTFLKSESIDMTCGEQKRNFTYVKDIIDAYLKTLKHITTTKKDYDIFNIGMDKPISIRKIANTLEEISSGKLSVNWCAREYDKDEIFYVNCSNAKAKNILGWVPQHDFKKGLKKTFLYYLNEQQHGNL